MLALCLALLELSKAKGGSNDRSCPRAESLVALVRSLLLPPPLETHRHGIPRNRGAVPLDASSYLVLRTAGCETKSSFFKSLVFADAWWVKGTVMVMVLLP